MFQQKKLVSAIVCSTLALSACNSNDDDNLASTKTSSSTTTITVTPSLGKILNARIALKNAKTGASIAATQTITPSNNGIATFTVPTSSLTDPVLAEVLPTATGIVQYFDEALEDNKTITVPTADIAKPILRAAASVAANANIGVTGLTEAAVQQAEKQVGGLIAQNINNANTAVKNALKLNFDVTQAPVVVGNGEFEKLINASISTALEAQRKAYATYLATLAKEAQRINTTSTTPAYDMAKAFANDFSHDGTFNGVGSQTLAINYTNAFLTNWINWVQNFYASFAQLSNIMAFNRWYGGFNIVDKDSVKTFPDAVPIRTVDGVEEYACSGEGRIKSSTGSSIYMDFVNQRGSNMNIYWLDYNTGRVSYKQNLANGQTHNQQTFVTHPWLITDNTGTCIGIYRPVTATKKTLTFKTDGVMIGNGTPVEEVKTPATINAGLVKNYALKYNLTQNGGGYTAGQTLTASVSSAGDLVIGGFVLKNPYYDKINGVDFTGEVVWKEGNIKYALSNNTTGVFNEIKVFDTNKTNPFLGQFVLETPVLNNCSSTGNDTKLGFRNAPTNFCSFTYDYGTSTNNTPDEYIFQGNIDNKTAFAKVNVVNGNVQSFRLENNTLGYACGVGDMPACVGITIQKNDNQVIEFKFANVQVANVDTTKQGMIIDSGLLMHKKATQTTPTGSCNSNTNPFGCVTITGSNTPANYFEHIGSSLINNGAPQFQSVIANTGAISFFGAGPKPNASNAAIGIGYQHIVGNKQNATYTFQEFNSLSQLTTNLRYACKNADETCPNLTVDTANKRVIFDGVIMFKLDENNNQTTESITVNGILNY